VLGILGHPGAFAEFLTLPENNLHPLPESISDQQAVFIEPLAAACEILDQVSLASQLPAAVFGDGKLGLLVAEVLHQAGAEVTLYGRHPHKLALAANTGVAAVLESDARPARYPLVVECTGSASGLEQAIRCTEPRGTIVMKSTVHNRVQLDTASVIVNEISLVGSRCGRFEPAIELLATGKVNVRSLITAEYPLSQAAEAFAHAARRGTLKVLLRPDGD
jgi:alcohol dehydrogenase